MKQSEVDELPPGLCVGASRLFDSTDPDDHERAANLCALCPRAEWCEDELKRYQGGNPAKPTEGTWAGRLLVDAYAPVPSVRRPSCGTPTGAYYHRRHREVVCDDCGAARREYDRGRGK